MDVGDLLTTSDTPGHAMKVTDHAKAQGTILGKAMTAWNRVEDSFWSWCRCSNRIRHQKHKYEFDTRTGQ